MKRAFGTWTSVVAWLGVLGLIAAGAAALPLRGSLALHAAGLTVLAQEPDTDGDTMPDAWETFFGLDPADPSDATGDPDGDGLTNAQEFAARRHPVGRHARYFAEGSTGFFSTSLGLLNLSTTGDAHVAIALLNEAGAVVSHRLRLGPRQRQTVSINDVLGVSAAIAIVVESDVPVAADRWMTWGASGIGASLDSGSPAPATTWYFAEGATGPFLLFYLFENPAETPANVTVRYLLEGRPPLTKTRTLSPHSRTTVFVNADDPTLLNGSMGSVITSDVPIFAERAMYLLAGGTLGGGAASAGSNQLSTQWYFGEGSTGRFFHAFLAMLNPGTVPATATVTYHLQDGSTVSKAYAIAAEGRRTVYFNDEAARDPALAVLATGPVWFTVSSTQPILSERVMWWPEWPWYEGHAAPGSTTSAASWAIPEGRTGGQTQEQTYVLVGNTTTTAGQIRLTLIPDTGAPSTRELPIPASQRLTLNIGALFGLTEARFSVVVDSIGASPVPLAVDYARYRSVNGVIFSGGGAAPAVPVVVGDAAPTVTATTPAANATGVAVDTNLTVTFSEPVTAGAGAFVLECPIGTTIPLTSLTASPATTFTLDPAADLPVSTACRLRVVASEIADADAADPPDELAADVTVPFTTGCPTIAVSPTTVPGGTINVAYAPVQFTQTGGATPIAWSLTAGALPAGMTLSAGGLLAGTPTASGSFSFSVTATDANTCPGSAPLTLSILANPNVAPSFTAGASQTVLEDAGAQTVAAWATGISPGPPAESGQVLTFAVTGNTNPALFSAGPAVSPTGTLTYTPAPNANGSATIEIALQDNGGTAGGGDDTSDPQSFTITVTAVNDAPSFTLAPVPAVLEDAGPQSVTVTTAVSAGPADEAAQTVSFSVTANTNPALFSAGPLVAPDGTLTFTPAANAAGSATVTIAALDTGGTANGGADTSAPQDFTIAVTAVNDPPTAFDDAAATDEDTPLTVTAPGVLANDVDPDTGDTRTVIDVNGNPAAVGTTITLPSGGLLTANADGSGSYDPRPVAAFQALGAGQSAIDSFTYTMQDALGATSTATVILTITGVNDAPSLDLDLDDDGGTPPTTGTGFAIAFAEGGPAAFIQDEIDATITDVDSPTLTTLTVTVTNVLDSLQEDLDVDLVTGGFDANFTKVFDETTTPGVAVLTITAATPQPIASFNTLLRRVTYQNLDAAPDASAPRAITFVVGDGTGTSAAATATVTIQAADSPPVADNDSYSVAEGGTLTIAAPGVLDGDTDPEGGTPITAALVTGPVNASAFTLNSDGSFTYTHNGSETTSDTFTYQASANGLLSNTATVTITMTNVNDAPTAVNDVNTTTEDAPVTAAMPGVLANDTDPDPGDTKTVSSVHGLPANVGTLVTLASGATVTLNANGSYTYNPLSAFQSLGAGQTATDTFTYTIQDAAAAQSNTATVEITITGVNDAPVVTAGAGTAAFTEDGAAVAVAPALTVTDADSTTLASATVQITGNYQNGQDVLAFVNQAGISGVFTAATGTLTLTGSASLASWEAALRSVTYANTSQNPNTGARTVTFQVNDGTANSNLSTRGVTVTAVNDAPVITTPGAVNTFTEDGPAVVVDSAVTIADPDNANMASATVTLLSPPDGLAEGLGATSCAGLTVGGAGTATLSITGSQPIATYEACLRSVTYANTSQNPNPTQRTVTFVVNDGSVASVAASKLLNVVPVNDAPVVANETFDVLGNTELRVDRDAVTTPHTAETTTNPNTVEGVLDNEADPEGNPFAVTGIANCTVADTTAPFDCTLTDGAVVHVEANGEFSYTPGPGDTTGSFTYTVTDQPSVGTAASVNGTVTFAIVEQIWYVDADAAAGGTGTSLSPFNTFTAATLSGVNGAGDLDDADDYIFVHSSTVAINAGIELEAGQHLIGQAAGLSIPRSLNGNASPAVVVAPGGTPPVINGGAGNSVTVSEAMPAEIRGLTLGSLNAIDVTTDAALSGAATLTIANNVINAATAEGIDVNLNAGTTGTLSLAITGNSWNLANSHAGNAVDISRAAGTLNLNFSNNTNIVSANAAVVINGGAAASTFITGFTNNTIHGNTAGAGVSISNVTFDAAPGGPIDVVNGGILTIGASGNAVGGAGAVFSAVGGSLSLADLDVFGGTSGLTAAGLNLAVTPNVGTISAANGAGVDVSTGTLDLRLSTLTVTTGGAGVSLNALAAGSQFSAAAGSSITKSSGAGTAFSVASSNVAMSYAGTLNVTSGSGVSLTSNDAAATFAFSGGMTLSTGANAAFTATGGGTVSVVDPAGAANNTITTTTGVALNVANTTIGASGLTFQSIAANGAASGIVLNATGATGGLTVTGTGPAGSGGTIQNITNRGASFIGAVNIALTDMNFTNANTTDGGTSDGVVGSNTDENAAIHLENVTQVDLTDLVIDGTAQHGINGSNVTDLDISTTTIQNTGDEVWESNVYLWDLKGVASAGRTSVFTGLTLVNDSGQFNIWIQNNDGTNDRPGEKDRVEITNSAFTRNGNNALISDNITVANSGTGNTQVVVSNSTFTATATCGAPAFAGACVSDNIQVDAGNNAAFDFDLSTGNNLTGGNAGQAAVNISASGAGQGTFNVRNVTTSVRAGQGINVALTTTNASASLRGTIANNTISTNVANNPGSGIQMVLEGAGTMVVDVNNNTINGNATNQFDYGIRGGARAGSGTAEFQINNNSVPSTEAAGVWFFAGNGMAGESSRTCVNFVSNLIDGFNVPTVAFTDYFVEMHLGTTFQLQGLTGSGTDAISVGNFISSTDDDPAAGDPAVDAGSGTTVNYTNAVCAAP